jgi:hypothetical protein
VCRSVSQTSHHHHGPHGVDGHHRELLELEYEEEILELSGYHHRPPSLVGHVNSAYTGGFLPFGDSASSIATASPPPLLPPLPPAASAASTLVLGNQFSETTYYKLTAGTPQSTTSRGSRGSRGSNSSSRRKASDAAKEEIQDDDEEASLRELLMRWVHAPARAQLIHASCYNPFGMGLPDFRVSARFNLKFFHRNTLCLQNILIFSVFIRRNFTWI